jgi:hypothetical protein
MVSSSKMVQVLRVLTALSAAVSGMAMKMEQLERRAAQTTAVCSVDYAWADTTQGNKSPCFVAAELLSLCNGGSA